MDRNERDEREADLFAMELLMPLELLQKSLWELRSAGGVQVITPTLLDRLSEEYQVEPMIMQRRLEYLANQGDISVRMGYW